MSEHRNVTVINRMTEAAIAGDKKTLADCFTEDVVFHVRGTLPQVGDHRGVEGFLGVIGTIMELTAGDVKLEQLFAIANDEWAAEWERALLGRSGRTLDTHNSFIYRFEDGRIAEMWMVGAGPAGSESFFQLCCTSTQARRVRDRQFHQPIQTRSQCPAFAGHRGTLEFRGTQAGP